jgi:hypothetical protein
MSFSDVLDLIKTLVVPALVYMGHLMRQISTDINQIKMSLAQNDIKHEDLRSDVEDIKKNQEARNEIINKIREDIAGLKRKHS